jgi:hypothetical protein
MSAAAAACPAFHWPSPGLTFRQHGRYRAEKGHLPAAGCHRTGLKNVVAHHARVEQMTGQYAQISSRAFAELGCSPT